MRKMGMERRRPEQCHRALGTGHRAHLSCWPGLLLRGTEGGKDTKKLRWRQQEIEEIPVIWSEFSLSKLGTGEPGGSSGLQRL